MVCEPLPNTVTLFRFKMSSDIRKIIIAVCKCRKQTGEAIKTLLTSKDTIETSLLLAYSGYEQDKIDRIKKTDL